MTEHPELPQSAKSKRPAFFDDPAVDSLLSMVIELSAEVWTLKERLAAIEDLAQKKALFKTDDIESHVLSKTRTDTLFKEREEFTARLFRTIEQTAG